MMSKDAMEEAVAATAAEPITNKRPEWQG